MDVRKTSIRLPNGNFLSAQEASDQYWAQMPARGYVEGGREPRFNATASGRNPDLTNIHEPVTSPDADSSSPPLPLKDSGSMLIFGDERIVDDGADVQRQVESDPAFADIN